MPTTVTEIQALCARMREAAARKGVEKPDVRFVCPSYWGPDPILMLSFPGYTTTVEGQTLAQLEAQMTITIAQLEDIRPIQLRAAQAAVLKAVKEAADAGIPYEDVTDLVASHYPEETQDETARMIIDILEGEGDQSAPLEIDEMEADAHHFARDE